MATKRDYYEVLEVDKRADKEAIKKAYRKLAMKHHPDRNPNDKRAEAKFKEASEAAQVLLDDQKRARYDQFGHAGMEGPGGFGTGEGGLEGFADLGNIFGDIFSDFFGHGQSQGGGGRGRRGTRSWGQRGDDLQVSLNIPFEEAAFGTKKTITIPKNVSCSDCHGKGVRGGGPLSSCDMCGGAGEIRRQQGFFMMATTCPQCRGSGEVIKDPCPTCRGDGRVEKDVDLEVKVPAGIDEGQRLKLSGEGGAGLHGAPTGDLYLSVQVDAHEVFIREGFDVHCIVPITFSQAALGVEVEVPTLSGKVALKITPGTQSGKKMRLKNKGIKRLGAYGQGDQIVQIRVDTPTDLSSEQEDLLRKLADFEKKSPSPGQGLFGKVKDLFQ